MDIIMKTARYIVHHSTLEQSDNQIRQYAELIGFMIEMPRDSAIRLLQFAVDELEAPGERWRN